MTRAWFAAGSGVEPGGHSNNKYTVGGPGVGSGEVNLDQKFKRRMLVTTTSVQTKTETKEAR